MNDTTTPFKEIVTERIGNNILASRIEEVTEEEIKSSKKLFETQNICAHSIVVDYRSWLYDFRSCHICGKGLGTV